MREYDAARGEPIEIRRLDLLVTKVVDPVAQVIDRDEKDIGFCRQFGLGSVSLQAAGQRSSKQGGGAKEGWEVHKKGASGSDDEGTEREAFTGNSAGGALWDNGKKRTTVRAQACPAPRRFR